MTAMHMLVGAPNVACEKLLDWPLLAESCRSPMPASDPERS
jgi:hypothetical protein